MASNNNSINFMTNYKYRVKSNLKLMIVIAILHFFGAPVNLINFMVYGLQQRKLDIQHDIYGLEYNSAHFNEWYPIIGVLTTIAALICVFIVVFNVFNYLYKRQNVDMILSLPMSSKTRFWSDFSAALTIYIGPFIVNSVISLILSVVMNGIFAEELKETGSLVGGLSDEVIFFRDFFTTVLPLVLLGIGVMLFLFTMTLIVAVCCGSLFESIAYSLGIHILIPLTATGLGLMLFMNAYGINPLNEIRPAIEVTSPFGIIIGFIWGMFESLDLDGGASINLIVLKFTLIPLVISAALSAVSYFLYIRRKAESTGKPFVYKTLYYIVITAVTLCIGSFMLGPVYELFMGYGQKNIFAVMLIPFIINTAIAYLIMEVITNRGFKKFGKSVIKYLITIVATVAIILTSDLTHGFGVAKYVPNAGAVSSVSIRLRGDRYLGDGVEIKDDEGIKLVTELHKEIVKHAPKNSEGYSEGIPNMISAETNYRRIGCNITYIKNIGGSVVRDYDGMKYTPEIAEKLDRLMNSTVYNKAVVESMRDSMLTKLHYSTLSIAIAFENVDMSNYEESTEIIKYDRMDKPEKKAANRKLANEIFDALIKDIEAHDADGRNVNTGKMKFIMFYSNNSENHIYIYDDYVNTIEVLKAHNINLNISEDSYERIYGRVALYPPELSKLFNDDNLIYRDTTPFALIEDEGMTKSVLDNLKPYSVMNEQNGDYTVVVNQMKFNLDKDKKNLISSHVSKIENEFLRLANKYEYKGTSGTVTLGKGDYEIYEFNNETEFGVALYCLIYADYINDMNLNISYDNDYQQTIMLNGNSDRVGFIVAEKNGEENCFQFVGKESFEAVYKKLYNAGYSVNIITFINADGIYDDIYYGDTKPVLDLDRYDGRPSEFGKKDLSGRITADDISAEWLFTGYREYCAIIDELYDRKYNGYSVKYNNSQGEPLHYELNYDDIMANYNHYRDGNSATYQSGKITSYNESGNTISVYEFNDYNSYCDIVDTLVNEGVRDYTVAYDGMDGRIFGFSLNHQDRSINYANFYIPGNN